MKYVVPLIVVDEMARSRHFYEQLLGQKARYDFGEDVQFEGDFTIHAIHKQPWGQRAMRLYDPDGHIIEIGEVMEAAQ